MIDKLLSGQRRGGSQARLHVGLFGLLGSGNLGNDGSMESVLAYLRAEHPDASVSCLCGGPAQITARYGVPAVRLYWNRRIGRAGIWGSIVRLFGKLCDIVRTALWVRSLSIVIVPGMGVLEQTVPSRPWGFPFALFLVCAAGRLFGVRVALVSVGASTVQRRANRFLLARSASLAHYCSYRDDLSKDAVQLMGVETKNDLVYPDLAFALPDPEETSETKGLVGLGVMSYFGGEEDRGRGEDIHRAYIETMTEFTCWLLRHDRVVRLFGGDQMDDTAVSAIYYEVRRRCPEYASACTMTEPVQTLGGLMVQLQEVEVVVATRYHNVLCALKLAKPTVAVSYAAKTDVLMADMGLGEFCQSARCVQLDRLIQQFGALESQQDRIRPIMSQRSRWYARLLGEQFSSISATVFDLGKRRSRVAWMNYRRKGQS